MSCYYITPFVTCCMHSAGACCDLRVHIKSLKSHRDESNQKNENRVRIEDNLQYKRRNKEIHKREIVSQSKQDTENSSKREKRGKHVSRTLEPLRPTEIIICNKCKFPLPPCRLELNFANPDEEPDTDYDQIPEEPNRRIVNLIDVETQTEEDWSCKDIATQTNIEKSPKDFNSRRKSSTQIEIRFGSDSEYDTETDAE